MSRSSLGLLLAAMAAPWAAKRLQQQAQYEREQLHVDAALNARYDRGGR